MLELESCVRGHLAMATFAEGSEPLPLRLRPPTLGVGPSWSDVGTGHLSLPSASGGGWKSLELLLENADAQPARSFT